ncbi:MAG TPA: hypothetical protein VF582_06425 [Allosphingosinicella sp.]|jgi:hypothetical protein
MKPTQIMPLLVAALAAQACSSRPREFSPTLHAAPADEAAYRLAYSDCQAQLAAGKLNRGEALASGGVGAAVGVATGAVGAAAAGSTTGFLGGMAIAGATIIAAPVVAVVGAWGMAKTKKLKKEKAIQEATARCLGERGYQVAEWKRAKR